MFESVNWHAVFVPSMPVLEIVVRGTVVYLAIFLLLRLVLKRQSGNLGVSDLLVIVLSAHAWGETFPKTLAAAKKLADKGSRLLERYAKATAKK